MSRRNRRIVLTRYAEGDPTPGMFALAESETPAPGDGEALAQTLWLSMDPFPRMQMTGAAGGPPQLPLGEVVIGRGVARVLESRRGDLAPGDLVVCDPGWQEWALLRGDVRRLDPALAPPSAALGVCGPSGLTALFALTEELRIAGGETLVVTAAAGSVGLAACQIGAALGARVVAVASGEAQIAFLRERIGVAAAIDRLAAGDLAAALADAAPEGVHAALDTVGGETFEAILRAARPQARIVMAGFISVYGGARPRYVDPYAVVFKRARLKGFLLADYAPLFDEGYARLAAWLNEGRLAAHEAVTHGLENAPKAFAALFQAAAPGKQIVKVAD